MRIDDIIKLCKQYPEPDDFHDFEIIWEYIQACNTLEDLESLTDVIPLGMLKYRLNERISALKPLTRQTLMKI